jgi:hypothetical protein
VIKTKGKIKLSVRGIEFGGGAVLENQQRGSDFVKIKYAILTEKINPSTGDMEDVAVSFHEATFNGQFKDEEFKEALLYFKKLVVKIVQEYNNDVIECVDNAIEKINSGK